MTDDIPFIFNHRFSFTQGDLSHRKHCQQEWCFYLKKITSHFDLCEIISILSTHQSKLIGMKNVTNDTIQDVLCYKWPRCKLNTLFTAKPHRSPFAKPMTS